MHFFSSFFSILAILTCAGHTLAHPAFSERQISLYRKNQLADQNKRIGNSERLSENHSTNILELSLSEPFADSDHQPVLEGSDLISIDADLYPNMLNGDGEQDIKLYRRKNLALKKIGGIAKAVGKGGAQMAGSLIM